MTNRRSIIEITRFEAMIDEKQKEMLSLEARWSTSLDPDGGELVELTMAAEIPADPSLTVAELEQRALAQIIRAAELLASETPSSLSRRLRTPSLSLVSSPE